MTACLLGDSVSNLSSAVKEHGADNILLGEQADLATYSPGVYASGLAAAVAETGAEVILMSSSSMGRELSAILAARIGASLVSDVVATNWSGDHLE